MARRVSRFDLSCAYSHGKKAGYTSEGKLFHLIKKDNPYDRRTKHGRAWFLGVCHALDEQKCIFFEYPWYCIPTRSYRLSATYGKEGKY